jgi:UrcA family protein
LKTLALCAVIAGLALPAAATANPFDVTSTAKAPYGDLDLSTPRGAARMLDRIDAAALKTCGASEFSLRDYQKAVRRTACYRDSLTSAVADLNAPTVTALFHARMPVRMASN